MTVHYFIFKDEAARDAHANSEAVKRFTDALYPRLVAPVEFTEYSLLVSTKPNP
jgi:quinol monooxygenase YgiN